MPPSKLKGDDRFAIRAATDIRIELGYLDDATGECATINLYRDQAESLKAILETWLTDHCAPDAPNGWPKRR
jgi:hypothetical protein